MRTKPPKKDPWFQAQMDAANPPTSEIAPASMQAGERFAIAQANKAYAEMLAKEAMARTPKKKRTRRDKGPLREKLEVSEAVARMLISSGAKDQTRQLMTTPAVTAVPVMNAPVRPGMTASSYNSPYQPMANSGLMVIKRTGQNYTAAGSPSSGPVKLQPHNSPFLVSEGKEAQIQHWENMTPSQREATRARALSILAAEENSSGRPAMVATPSPSEVQEVREKPVSAKRQAEEKVASSELGAATSSSSSEHDDPKDADFQARTPRGRARDPRLTSSTKRKAGDMGKDATQTPAKRSKYELLDSSPGDN